MLFTCIANLPVGSIFGEKGLDESTPRTATVVCSQDCDFAYLLKVDYDLCLKEINKADAERRRDFFTKDVFKGMVGSHVTAKIAFDFYKRKMTLKKGDYIMKQGTRDKFITVVRHG